MERERVQAVLEPARLQPELERVPGAELVLEQQGRSKRVRGLELVQPRTQQEPVESKQAQEQAD